MRACSRLAVSSSAHATTEAAGSRRAISRARLGPLTTAIRSAEASVTSWMTSLIRISEPSSTPFISDTRVACGREDRRPVGEVLAKGLRRDGQDDHVGAGRDLLGVARRRHRGRQLDAGEVVGVLATIVDRLDDLLASAPQHDVVAGVGEHQREGRAPRPGTEDSDLGHRLRFLLGPRASSLGLPVSRTPRSRGSKRCSGGYSPRRSATRSVIAAMIRSVAWAMTSPVCSCATRSARSTGSPAFIVMCLRGHRCGFFV